MRRFYLYGTKFNCTLKEYQFNLDNLLVGSENFWPAIWLLLTCVWNSLNRFKDISSGMTYIFLKFYCVLQHFKFPQWVQGLKLFVQCTVCQYLYVFSNFILAVTWVMCHGFALDYRLFWTVRTGMIKLMRNHSSLGFFASPLLVLIGQSFWMWEGCHSVASLI